MVNYLKSIFFKKDFWCQTKIIEKYKYSKEYVVYRKGNVIFIDSNKYSKYVLNLQVISFYLKTNKNILFLDSRASFLQVIDFFIKGSKKKLESFQGLTLKGLLTNFKSNQNFCKGYGYSSLLNKPDMLIVFDSLENLDLLKEANIAGIPVICFTDINKSYSNIYNISFNSNFRNFIMLLVTIQKLLFFAKHLSYRWK